MAKQTINIEVTYAGEEAQAIIPLSVKVGTTVLEGILQSRILSRFSDIQLQEGRAGIFGKIVPLNTTLKEGDRVEIYRDLKRDPKVARRERAKVFKAAQHAASASKRAT